MDTLVKDNYIKVICRCIYIEQSKKIVCSKILFADCTGKKYRC